jgi:hypothetical protein
VSRAAVWTRKARRSYFRTAGILALLMALALAAAGHFEAAASLTLGAAVAIVGALWLADLVHRFGPLEPSAAPEFSWKFAATGLLRYGLAGLLVWGAVRLFPQEIPWLLVGASVAAGAAVWQTLVAR